MATTERFHLSNGDLFQGRYRVGQELGKGGMGAVYEVVDENTQRHRALKVMLPTMLADTEMRQRFRREATVAARIDSAHIAEVLDAGVDDASGAPFMVMELLKGEDLDQLVHRRGPLPPDEVAHYLWQASLALDKAHAAGVVHRDLKPENLYVTYRDDGAPWIKILDFGIAKVIAETASGMQTQGILGTPLFMSPEQIHGELDVTPQSDVYAIAHIAYALLVGEPYFLREEESSKGVYQMVLKLSKGPLDPATQRAKRANVHLPAAFDGWFARGAAEHPEDRFAKVSEAVLELARALKVKRADTFAPTMMPYVSRPEWSLLPVTSQQPVLSEQVVISEVPRTPKMVEESPPMTDRLPAGYVSTADQQAPPQVAAVVAPSGSLASSLDPFGRTLESEKTLRGHQPPNAAGAGPATPLNATVIDQPATLQPTLIDEPSYAPAQGEAAPYAAPRPESARSFGAGTAAPVTQSVSLAVSKRSNAPLLLVLASIALIGVGIAIWSFIGDGPATPSPATEPAATPEPTTAPAEPPVPTAAPVETPAAAPSTTSQTKPAETTPPSRATAEPPPPAPPPTAKPPPPPPPPPAPAPPEPINKPVAPVR